MPDLVFKIMGDLPTLRAGPKIWVPLDVSSLGDAGRRSMSELQTHLRKASRDVLMYVGEPSRQRAQPSTKEESPRLGCTHALRVLCVELP